MSCPKTSITWMHGFWFAVVWWLAIAAMLAGSARGDVFKLSCGGQLQGVWLDHNQNPITQYEIRLQSGGRIVLAIDAVKEVIRAPDVETQYQLVVAEHGKDIADHLAIAQWCRAHGLKQHRRHHLERILRLDANHADARRGLGYSFVRGRWVTQDEFMREQGYVTYKGHWRLPQQVELEEAKRKRDADVRQWYRQLLLWRRELGTDRAAEFSASITGIKDPHAVAALVRLEQRESARGVRLLYLRALANIGTSEALRSLLLIALTDHDEEVIHGCLDYLVQAHNSMIHQGLLGTLRHEDNFIVNRAAMALDRLGEDASIDALIDALVTQHLVRIYNPRADQVELHRVSFSNRTVLTTLVDLTGASGFGYDKKAWKQWRFMQVKQAHAAQAKLIPVRRDASK